MKSWYFMTTLDYLASLNVADISSTIRKIPLSGRANRARESTSWRYPVLLALGGHDPICLRISRAKQSSLSAVHSIAWREACDFLLQRRWKIKERIDNKVSDKYNYWRLTRRLWEVSETSLNIFKLDWGGERESRGGFTYLHTYIRVKLKVLL